MNVISYQVKINVFKDSVAEGIACSFYGEIQTKHSKFLGLWLILCQSKLHLLYGFACVHFSNSKEYN